MNHPPSLPPALPSHKGLITAAYIFSGLSLLPLFGFLAGVVGVILGIILCTKNKVTHGATAIVLSGLFAFIIGPIVTIAILTLLGDHLKEIFEQVTASLETPPPH